MRKLALALLFVLVFAGFSTAQTQEQQLAYGYGYNNVAPWIWVTHWNTPWLAEDAASDMCWDEMSPWIDLFAWCMAGVGDYFEDNPL